MGLIFKKSTAQPSFTVAAAITGTTEATQTLTCAYTVVRARAVNVTVRWYRHTADDGTDPTGVLLGTGTTYTLTGTDVGNYIRAIVTAINPAGTVQSTTSYTAIITSGDPPEPPALVTPAAITGTADVGETLTVTATFSGETSITYQWYSYSDENGGDPIELGTADTQVLTASEAGRWIGATVTATNAVDSTVTSDIVAMAGVDSWTPVAPTQVVVPEYDETGKTYIYANAGDDLQAKLNAVQPGQVLVLQAGATWTGQYRIYDKGGSDWVYIVSSALADLPAEGTRVAIEDAANMPKITTGTSLAHVTLRVEKSAQKVRMVGLEITTGYNTPSSAQYGIVRLADAGSGVCDSIVFDRCYIHGAPIGNNRDGVVIYQASNVAVKECYITDFKAVGFESHGVNVFKPTGPVLIENNRIEAAGINVFIGDSASAYNNVSQRFGDITVRGNYLTKKLSWEANEPTYAGYDVIRKNCLEIKTGSRVLIEGNLIENSWPGDQTGDLILANLVSGWGNDIHIKNNILRQGANGIYLSTSGSNPIPDTMMDRVLIENNLIYGLRKYLSGITGGAYIRLGGKASIPMRYVTIQNNTLANDLDLKGTWGFATGVAYPCVENIRIRNNVARAPSSGLFQTTLSVGSLDSNDIFEAVCTGEIAMHHCLYYPSSTQVNNLTENGTNVYNIDKVASSASVDYVGEEMAYSYANWATATLSDFALQATSAGWLSGSDGNNKGVDITALAAAMNDSI